MEIDLSKENIQPLRGGRNVAQLEVALHAQTDSEYQKELLQQKEALEEAIRSYEGDDPLDPWYNYISWVEQSYPKHGHEGNLVALLEDCLSNFETDERYVYDRRMCKLWIKFIDLQQNPLELFQLLHSKGICVTCADLYRAWAYYHEVAEDYKRADAVFQLGIQALAQPYEELVAAHQNFFGAIGKQAIHGVDERRLVEQRQALTSLRSYTHKRRTMVTSSRTGSQVLHSTPGTLLGKEKSSRASNAPIMLYEDQCTAGPSIGAGAASMSILAVARKQDILHKENVLKPSPWNLKRNIITPKVAHRVPVFKVHEDELVGIKLPPDFAPMNHDDFSDWKPNIYYFETPNPNSCPMYPKNLVYAEPDIEYSLEEIRARKYHVPNQTKTVNANASVNIQETTMEDTLINQSRSYQHQNVETVTQSIQPLVNESILAQALEISYHGEVPQTYVRQSILPQNVSSQAESNKSCASSYIADSFKSRQHNLSQRESLFSNVQKQLSPEIPQVAEEASIETFIPKRSIMSQKFSLYEDQEQGETNTPRQQPQKWVSESVATAEKQQWMPEPIPKVLEKKDVPWPSTTIVDNNYTVNQDINYIWKDDTTALPEPIVVPKPQMSTFKIHEDTKCVQEDVEPSVPEYRKSLKPIEDRIQPDFKAPKFSLTHDVLEDNVNKQTLTPGLMYRKSLKMPFSSQPLPEPIREYPQQSASQNFVHPSEVLHKQPLVNLYHDSSVSNLNESCTTQTFNFDINAYKISTPYQNKKAQPYRADASIFNIEPQQELKQNKKVLFEENEHDETPFVQPKEVRSEEKLSIILETTKEYGSSSSSSSSGLTFKTTTFNHRESLRTIQESSSHEEEKSKTQSMTATNQMHSEDFNDSNEGSNINNYSMLKQFLNFDSPISARQQCNAETSPNNYGSQSQQLQNLGGSQNMYGSVDQSQHVIDLTEENDVSNMNGQSDASNYQIQSKSNFEFPSLTEHNYESNDSMSNSPVKGSNMEVDVNNLLSQNSNSEFKMDYDSCPASVTPLDETILQNPSDPFSSKLKQALLNRIKFPKASYASNYTEQQSLPRLLGRKECVVIGDEKYLVEKVIGKGAFGSVYKATNMNKKNIVALKYQKPPDVWEFYIAKEIRERIFNSHMLHAFMDAYYCFTSRTASILISDFCKLGSLLDLTNKVKQASSKGFKELVAIYFAREIITIVNTLHQCRIIHGDIKPDNFLVTRMPPQFGYPSLQLIDFGCSIDMSLFPQETTFTKVISTENFTCTEMKDGRPWTYQTDIFCVAATVHVLLFEKYMQMKKNGDVWLITQRIPRYMRTDLWNTFFFQLLNITSCDKLPDLNMIKAPFDTILTSQNDELQVDLRYVANCVLGR